MQQIISTLKFEIKRKLPAKRKDIPVINIALTVELNFHQAILLQKQKIIAGMPEKSQQKQPAQKKAKKHLPAVSAAIQKRKK